MQTQGRGQLSPLLTILLLPFLAVTPAIAQAPAQVPISTGDAAAIADTCTTFLLLGSVVTCAFAAVRSSASWKGGQELASESASCYC